MQVLFAIGILEYSPLSYGSYTYTGWAELFCWLVAAAPIMPMLLWPLYLLMRRGLDIVCSHDMNTLIHPLGTYKM